MTEESNPSEIFATRLTQARQIRELSQQDLARLSGLPASSISHFEKGSRRPSFDNLRRLANTLDVTTDFLIGRTEVFSAPAAAQTLHRNLDRLTSHDLKLADRFIKMLAEKDPPDESGNGA